MNKQRYIQTSAHSEHWSAIPPKPYNNINHFGNISHAKTYQHISESIQSCHVSIYTYVCVCVVWQFGKCLWITRMVVEPIDRSCWEQDNFGLRRWHHGRWQRRSWGHIHRPRLTGAGAARRPHRHSASLQAMMIKGPIMLHKHFPLCSSERWKRCNRTVNHLEHNMWSKQKQSTKQSYTQTTLAI